MSILAYLLDPRVLGFINNMAQMIIMTRGCVASKNHVASSKFKVMDHT